MTKSRKTVIVPFESTFSLPIPNTDFKVYGRYRPAQHAKSKPNMAPVVVMIHGLGGSIHEHIHYNGSTAIASSGFDVLRINLYGSEVDARNLMDCTVDTHVSDLAVVLRELRAQQRRIAVVGHSLGGLVVQRTDRSFFDAAVLWDPADTQMPRFGEWGECEWNAAIDAWIMHWGTDVLVSKALERSWWESEPDRHDLQCPTKVIAAGASWMPEPSRRYIAAQSGPSELSVINDADHGFKEGEYSQYVFAETISWLCAHL